jgi:HAD superfamily hydrolase (TIGR01549 family)
MMKEYEYYLFDWDGNLAKTLDVWLDACRYVAEKRGVKVTDEQIGSSFGAFVRHMKEWGIDDPEKALNETDAIAKQRLPNVDLYPDALEVLIELSKRGKHLALITTSPHENVQHLLEKHGLKQYFEAIVAADDTYNHKPHPEPLEKALGLLGGTKEHAVMIGDSDKDLGAAHNFEIDSILFYPDEHRKFYDLEKLKKLEPTFIIEDFKTILEPFSE